MLLLKILTMDYGSECYVYVLVYWNFCVEALFFCYARRVEMFERALGVINTICIRRLTFKFEEFLGTFGLKSKDFLF